ncbi:YheC/YheD family protein [Brevibacillus sp. SYP-B805]|uniref:YheC/YheD family endospore coat-associated protein n=1 Tax=Brevibacillus sp. SYP-B805 TaxID=1578199 RepID=UPI0013ECDD6B|nr:YheC/YheD family protein [Brevibacillus sp. SYP-B805]NGQ96381.1 YheC/YheD family protein [Brevibacillus sp. SYP-B805]
MDRIGIMLDWALMQKGIAGKQTYERLDYYAEIGKELGLEPVFFHPLHVDLKAKRVIGHFWNGTRLVPRAIRIPAVIHNRVLSGQPSTRAIIRQLSRHYKVYNELVVRDKGSVHQLLWKNEQLRPYLPKTRLFTRPTLVQFLGKFDVVYVKPAVGSVGEGVVRIERKGDRFLTVSSKLRKRTDKVRLMTAMRGWVGRRRFLVQQGIPLAKYQDRTFDVRVSVQRDGTREWCVSGMVAKVSNRYNKLSNLARGGHAVPLDQVLASLFPQEKIAQVKSRLAVAARMIAKEYAKHFPSLADLGLDMGIDREGNPYLIEVNVRDQRYSFFEAGELEMFKRTYRHPLEYGKSLFKQSKNT